MKTAQQEEQLKDKVFNLLFERSTVDGVRILYEDQWPIDEIVSLFKEEQKKYKSALYPKYPDLLPIGQKIDEWYHAHNELGAEIIFQETEDEDGVVRMRPLKAIYYSPLKDFHSAMGLDQLSTDQQSGEEK